MGKTKRGCVTIKTLCLRRSDLNEERKKHLDVLKSFRIIVNLSADDPQLAQEAQKAQERLNSAVKACAIFSSMARDLLAEEQ